MRAREATLLKTHGRTWVANLRRLRIMYLQPEERAPLREHFGNVFVSELEH